jgi:restriction endonuclease S subunit
LNRLKEFSLNNQKIFGNNEIMKLGNVCSFLPKSKRSAKYGNKEGLYPFYTSSQICSKYCDSYDYCDECLIIGSGGNANIKYNKEFSCSADNFIVKLNNGIITKYVYYYLLDNINILQKGFIGSGLKHISKEYIKNIKIPIPSLERQEEIVKYCESNDNLIRELEKDIEENKKQAQLFMSNVIKSNVLTGDNDINDSDNDIDNEDNGNEDDEEQNNNEETPSDCDNTDNTSDISDGSDIEETT